MRYALVDTQSNLVVNIIDWDGTSPYTPPNKELPVLVNNEVQIGWSYIDGNFIAPTPPPPPPTDWPPLAQYELDNSDITLLRTLETNTPIPDDWAKYRATLRLIVSGKESGPLPVRPPYPHNS